jgi:predicted nucleic acid binding AN1-type Zn finger protein
MKHIRKILVLLAEADQPAGYVDIDICHGQLCGVHYGMECDCNSLVIVRSHGKKETRTKARIKSQHSQTVR